MNIVRILIRVNYFRGYKFVLMLHISKVKLLFFRLYLLLAQFYLALRDSIFTHPFLLPIFNLFLIMSHFLRPYLLISINLNVISATLTFMFDFLLVSKVYRTCNEMHVILFLKSNPSSFGLYNFFSVNY